jgi:acyl phosphate:glycerol-3-phosphate acyltransferase
MTVLRFTAASTYVIAALSYLLGSIPFGYLLVRGFRGEDVRRTGSGNIGATNVSRTSPALGLATLVLDALKGVAAVALARILAPDQLALPAAAAIFAILGHIFPVWLRFRGGKGVATGLGSWISLAPKSVLALVGIFIAVLGLFRYVSLASILAVATLPLVAWVLNDYQHTPVVLALMAASALLIVAKHRENIRRLAAGNENRLHWKRG